MLAPSAAQEVRFGLTRRGLSVYRGGVWELALGRFQVHIGASSRNLSLEHAFELA